MGDRHALARTGQRLSPPLIQPYLCRYQDFWKLCTFGRRIAARKICQPVSNISGIRMLPARAKLQQYLAFQRERLCDRVGAIGGVDGVADDFRPVRVGDLAGAPRRLGTSHRGRTLRPGDPCAGTRKRGPAHPPPPPLTSPKDCPAGNLQKSRISS
jgi:hypothetical protein